MNATQDASNDTQNDINTKLIDYNAKQNDLIFATRKRLFQVEQNNKISFVLIGILTLAVLLLAINDTVIKGLI